VDRTWEIALAGLLHDVGKFFQRATSERATEENLHEFCPPNPDAPDRRTHHHAAYTAEFIETYLPWLSLKGQRDLNPMVWAARHHRPSSTLDWIIAEADRLSAGMDRGHPDESVRGWDQVRKRRLMPVLGRLHLDGKGGGTNSAQVQMKRLDMNRDNLFPLPRGSEEIALQEATQEYANLWEGFKDDLKKLPQGDLRSFFVSFLFLYEKWAWCIPAATNVEIVDVSLFEHSKVAAAIAACVYKQLNADGDEAKLLQTEIEKRTEPRYLLVCGDLSGIQQFIYTVKHEHAARALRGRSFALQLLTDAIAQHLLVRFDLPPCNLLYAGGGKFWVLLPLRADEELPQFSEEMDRFLLGRYQGRLGFAMGRTVLTGEDFVFKRIGEKWADAIRDLIKNRRHRLAHSARSNYDAVFAPFGRGAAKPCEVCGNELEETDDGTCQECKAFERIGAALTRAKTIVRWEGKDEEVRAREAAGGSDGSALLFTEVSVAYAVLPKVPARLSTSGSPVVFSVNSTDFLLDAQDSLVRGFWFLGRNRPEDEAGRVQTYEHLAKKSAGVERLGVLRMDVDSLGSLLEEGFGLQESSISRLTTFSKHLTYFFGGYLPHLIIDRMKLGDRVQVVYSGGDGKFQDRCRIDCSREIL